MSCLQQVLELVLFLFKVLKIFWRLLVLVQQLADFNGCRTAKDGKNERHLVKVTRAACTALAITYKLEGKANARC